MEHWFHGDGAHSADLEADAKALGVILPEPERRDFVVWEENQEAVEMFLQVQTQWRTGGGGGMVGMDYGAIAWLLRLYRVKDQRAILEDLQVMEATVLETMAKKGG